jgi:hypothetical protein
LAEDLAEYLDAFHDDPGEAAEREPWKKSCGPSEWENKKTTKFGGEVKTRARSMQYSLRRCGEEVLSLYKWCYSRHIFYNMFIFSLARTGPLLRS